MRATKTMLFKLRMPRLKKDHDLEALIALPWVETAERKVGPRGGKSDNYGYMVKTKPGALKVHVTHGIAKNGKEYFIGKKLEKPVPVGMPSLLIHVAPSKYGVTVQMADKPAELNFERFIPYPSWDGGGLQMDNWNYPGSPCWGDYYEYPGTYIERATFIADYLQHSNPHRAYHRGGSRYALWLGLLPAELIVEDKKADEDAYIEDIEEHDDDGWGCDCPECRDDDDDDWDD